MGRKMKKKENIIKYVMPNSIAEELEIEPGDILLSINGRPVVDIIDWMYLTQDDYIEIEIKKKNGEIWELEIDKEYDEELGLEFENPIIDKASRCSNNCIFCFIDQLPKGMRESLYFKDDDSRLSFLQGNFVTLTNLNEESFNRIIEYKISPINVSVHTTDAELRKVMLGNRFAGNILERLEKLTQNGIVVNAQIVLCPGYNDGDALIKTLNDLVGLLPNLKSVAIVPIGITKYRSGLAEIKGFDKKMASEVIQRVHEFQKKSLAENGTRFAFLADEFYILAEADFPMYEEYELFVQHEDGIGMVRKLSDEVCALLKDINAEAIKRNVLIVTGKAAEPYLINIVSELKKVYKYIDIDVKGIENNFFGSKITVAGLVTGKDIMEQVKEPAKYDVILLPEAMFRSGEDILLDDVTLLQLESYFKIPVVKVGESAIEFIKCVVSGGSDE